MSISIDINHSAFGARLEKWARTAGLEMPDAIRTQTRLLLKQVISFTPPQSLAQGRAAVARDITRSMTPIDLNDFPNERMRDRVNKLAAERNVQSLQALFRNTKTWKAWKVEQFAPQLHKFARDRRGRVQRSKRVFVPETFTSGRANSSRNQWAAYVKHMQAAVGRLKAAWGPAYKAVGGTLPSWVGRHQEVSGAVIDNLRDATRPSITFRNYATGVGQLERPFRAAFNARFRAVTADIRRILRQSAQKSQLQVKT